MNVWSEEPRECRVEGCQTLVVLARRAPVLASWKAFEYPEHPAWSRPDLWVLVGDQAWKPLDLIEHWHVTREITEEAARGLVGDYPFHLPHSHPRDEEEAA